MKKQIIALSLVLCTLLSGCSSGVSQEEYDALVAENEALIAENEELTIQKENINKSYRELMDAKNELESKVHSAQSELSDANKSLESFKEYEKIINSDEYKQFAELSEAEKEAEIANAEADKAESEARLKAAQEQLSKAQEEEQRKVTEGTTVYEDANVKINYLKAGKNPIYSWYECVIFMVENKTNGVITIQADSLALDGMDIGYISMSDEISPQSKGYIYANVDDSVSLNYSPKTISGQLSVIDFDHEAFATDWKNQSYEALFVNVVVSGSGHIPSAEAENTVDNTAASNEANSKISKETALHDAQLVVNDYVKSEWYGWGNGIYTTYIDPNDLGYDDASFVTYAYGDMLQIILVDTNQMMYNFNWLKEDGSSLGISIVVPSLVEEQGIKIGWSGELSHLEKNPANSLFEIS